MFPILGQVRAVLILAILVWLASTSVRADEVPETYRRQEQNRLSVDLGPADNPSPEVAVNRPREGIVPEPGVEVLDANRPKTRYPAILGEQDYFGRVNRPGTTFLDPFNSAAVIDGRSVAPGDVDIVRDRVRKITVEPWAAPTIYVAEEAWITLVLMREGEIVFPRSQLAGNDKMVDVRKSKVAESPYLFLRAKNGFISYTGDYLHTTLDVEVVDRNNKVYNYKFDLQIVPMNHQNYMPTVQVDMAEGSLPIYYGREGSKYATGASTAATVVTGMASQLSAYSSVAGSEAQPYTARSGMFSDGKRFSRADTRYFLPIFIGMAKAYDEAVRAKDPNYSPTHIVPFQPATIIPGANGAPQVLRGRIPAFRNPYDGQTYYLIRSYFFPEYDAILYDLSFRNRSQETLWWNYSQLQLIPGFEPSDRPEVPTVVTPESGEDTPPGLTNTLWVLVQGRGWDMSTPLRLIFPPTGMELQEPLMVQPHNETESPTLTQPAGEVNIFRRDTLDFLPSK